MKIYRKLSRKLKYKQYKNDIIEKLDNLEDNNPKTYWELLDKLQNCYKRETDYTSSIENQEWYEYFKNLNSGALKGQATISKELDALENKMYF